MAVAFVALVLGIAIGTAASSDTSTDASTDPTESNTSSEGTAGSSSGDDSAQEDTTTREDTSEGTIPGDGIYLVGEDIQPGTYRSEGDSDYGCYWARLSGTSGEFGDIIANGNPTGSVVVTIDESDVAFETTGCQDWTLVE